MTKTQKPLRTSSAVRVPSEPLNPLLEWLSRLTPDDVQILQSYLSTVKNTQASIPVFLEEQKERPLNLSTGLKLSALCIPLSGEGKKTRRSAHRDNKVSFRRYFVLDAPWEAQRQRLEIGLHIIDWPDRPRPSPADRKWFVLGCTLQWPPVQIPS